MTSKSKDWYNRTEDFHWFSRIFLQGLLGMCFWWSLGRSDHNLPEGANKWIKWTRCTYLQLTTSKANLQNCSSCFFSGHFMSLAAWREFFLAQDVKNFPGTSKPKWFPAESLGIGPLIISNLWLCHWQFQQRVEIDDYHLWKTSENRNYLDALNAAQQILLIEPRWAQRSLRSQEVLVQVDEPQTDQRRLSHRDYCTRRMLSCCTAKISTPRRVPQVKSLLRKANMWEVRSVCNLFTVVSQLS